MLKNSGTRRLAAIMLADVASYSLLMGIDEIGTLSALKLLRRTIFAPTIAKYHGRIVKLMGDGALVEFSSVVDAVTSAIEIQEALESQHASTDSGYRIQLKIGINLGDILIDGSDIYGDGVNVAARLQGVAKPGEILLSATAHEHVVGKVGARFVDEGRQNLKNIATPVHIFRWPAAVGAEQLTGDPGTLMLPDKPSIVILPFDMLSNDATQDYFSDGVVEAITASLSRIRSFFVIARNSAFAYKGEPKNVREIGQELGVAYLLEG